MAAYHGESSSCTQVELEPGTWAWRQVGYVSARFNEKIKEACIALVTPIQAPKFCCNLQESSRRIVLSTRLQACAEDMESIFRAVHKLLWTTRSLCTAKDLFSMEHHYEVLMVKAGAKNDNMDCTAEPPLSQTIPWF